MAKTMLALPAIMMMMMMMNAVVAEDHTVGDDDGWTFPSSPDFYIAWAARRNFVVGDTLVFNYATNAHTVAMVPRAAYEDCDAGNAEVHTDGPTEIPLNQTGTFFFICTIPGHCDAGLKLAINVAASSPSSPSSAPLSPPSDDTGSTSSPPMPLNSPSSPFGAPRSQPPDDTGTASSSPPLSLTSPTPSSGAPTSAPSDDNAGPASSQPMPLTYPLLFVSFIAFVLALN